MAALVQRIRARAASLPTFDIPFLLILLLLLSYGLIMLFSALAGREHILNAYNTAVKERYRFFSFGDAMFIS